MKPLSPQPAPPARARRPLRAGLILGLLVGPPLALLTAVAPQFTGKHALGNAALFLHPAPIHRADDGLLFQTLSSWLSPTHEAKLVRLSSGPPTTDQFGPLVRGHAPHWAIRPQTDGQLVYTVAFGWPLPILRASGDAPYQSAVSVEPTDRTLAAPAARRGRLAIEPSWPGVLAGLAFWITLPALLTAGFLRLQARRRVAHNACPACGYRISPRRADTKQITRCPECGGPLTP